MDFDTEAADDHRLAVKNWEDVLPLYLNCAGASSSDCESDNGLLTPPPDGQEDMDTVWIDPPPRPAYSDSWIRVMKKRVDEGCYSPVHDNDSDTSSVSSYSSDIDSYQYTQYALPADAHGSRGSCSDESDGLAFSGDSIDGGYKEGSTATIADAGKQALHMSCGGYSSDGTRHKNKVRAGITPVQQHPGFKVRHTRSSDQPSRSKPLSNDRTSVEYLGW